MTIEWGSESSEPVFHSGLPKLLGPTQEPPKVFFPVEFFWCCLPVHLGRRCLALLGSALSADSFAKAIARPGQMPAQTGGMGRVTFAHQSGSTASRIGPRRERLSIDFRQHGPALAAMARSRRMSVACLVRTFLGEWLLAQAVDSSPGAASDVTLDAPGPLLKEARFAKLTLRMPADMAMKLARQSRAAELSQGLYVSQLLAAQSDEAMDASPRELVAALVRANAELAALGVGLKALARALKRRSCHELGDLDGLVAGLIDGVDLHLASVATQLAALPASWRPAAVKPDLG